MEERKNRVANGSRRKRDLAVVEGPSFDFATFAATHFPPEQCGYARVAAFHVYMRHHKRQEPTVEEVRARMVELGWLPDEEVEQ